MPIEYFYPEYAYYTRTGRTVNTIKNGLPQIREAVSSNMAWRLIKSL